MDRRGGSPGSCMYFQAKVMPIQPKVHPGRCVPFDRQSRVLNGNNFHLKQTQEKHAAGYERVNPSSSKSWEFLLQCTTRRKPVRKSINSVVLDYHYHSGTQNIVPRTIGCKSLRVATYIVINQITYASDMCDQDRGLGVESASFAHE